MKKHKDNIDSQSHRHYRTFRKAKNAQVSTQLFLYILAIIIIGLLLIFGVKYIGELVNTTIEISLVQFKTDLQTNIDDIRPNYGKWRKLEITVPAEITEICFLEYDIPQQPQTLPICLQDSEYYDYLMCNAWMDYEAQVDSGADINEFPNVFAKPSGSIKSDITIGRIETSGDYYLCVPAIGNSIKIKAIGLGDGTQIEAW